MKPFIDQNFWSDPDIESASPQVKLATLWLITNSQTSALGICSATPRRFEFETALSKESLDEAVALLGDSFTRVGQFIFVKNYVRHQFGVGEKLTKNNFFISLRSQVLAIKDADLQRAVLAEYPEFAGQLPEGRIHKHERDHVVAPGLRRKVIERDEYKCLFTDAVLPEAELHVDHVVPRAKGGKTVPENLVAMSVELNVKKKDKDLEAFCKEAGFDFLVISERVKTRASKPFAGSKKPKERIGKEGEGSLFAKFWNEYPRKVGKAPAREAWEKLGCDEKADAIIAAVKRCRESADWKKEGGLFAPHPATWLNREGWEDELISPTAATAAKPIEVRL